MTLKRIAWNLFENTGNVEAYLTMKELEAQEKDKLKKFKLDGEIDGTNQN
ncbi:MAG: YqzL family protein [Clostridia bacterium]|nr:YqzL family protein [Clostridia bacterium]